MHTEPYPIGPLEARKLLALLLFSDSGTIPAVFYYSHSFLQHYEN
jgi:hypothetical protein